MLSVVILFTGLLTYSSVFAQDDQTVQEPEHPLLADKFHIGVGAFIFDKDINISVNGSDPGDNIDFDERWGIGSSEQSGSVLGRWRFGEKWSLFGQYFRSDDSARAVLEEDVKWEDITFKAGTNVGAGVDLSVARIFAGRTFSAGPRHEFGLGAGLHWLEIGAFIDGEVFVDDESTGFARRSVSANAPLPNIGGWYGYAFTPKWLFTAAVDWLYVDLGEYKGGLLNSGVGIQYQAFKHVGFQLRYQVFEIDVDIDKDSWRGSLDLQYKGPYMAVTFNW